MLLAKRRLWGASMGQRVCLSFCLSLNTASLVCSPIESLSPVSGLTIIYWYHWSLPVCHKEGGWASWIAESTTFSVNIWVVITDSHREKATNNDKLVITTANQQTCILLTLLLDRIFSAIFIFGIIFDIDLDSTYVIDEKKPKPYKMSPNTCIHIHVGLRSF